MRKYNISANIAYRCSSDEWQHGKMVLNNNRSKARILLFLALFNIFLERIIPDALEEHD